MKEHILLKVHVSTKDVMASFYDSKRDKGVDNCWMYYDANKPFATNSNTVVELFFQVFNLCCTVESQQLIHTDTRVYIFGLS